MFYLRNCVVVFQIDILVKSKKKKPFVFVLQWKHYMTKTPINGFILVLAVLKRETV